MVEKRRYKRYVLNNAADEQNQIKAVVEGEQVSLVDYSLGGVFFQSQKYFPMGAIINISIDLGKGGQINLMGKVVRVSQEGKLWGTALNFLTFSE